MIYSAIRSTVDEHSDDSIFAITSNSVFRSVCYGDRLPETRLYWDVSLSVLQPGKTWANTCGWSAENRDQFYPLSSFHNHSVSSKHPF